MDLSEAARVCSTSSGIPIFQKKYIKSGQYGGISRKETKNPRMKSKSNYTAKDKSDKETFQDSKEKDGNPPEVSRLESFE